MQQSVVSVRHVANVSSQPLVSCTRARVEAGWSGDTGRCVRLPDDVGVTVTRRGQPAHTAGGAGAKRVKKRLCGFQPTMRVFSAMLFCTETRNWGHLVSSKFVSPITSV